MFTGFKSIIDVECKNIIIYDRLNDSIDFSNCYIIHVGKNSFSLYKGEFNNGKYMQDIDKCVYLKDYYNDYLELIKDLYDILYDYNSEYDKYMIK